MICLQTYVHINLIGKNVLIPIVNRTVKIISDHYADPEQGSGAVKITPAHDFNDFLIGKKHHLEFVNIFDKNANIALTTETIEARLEDQNETK